MWNPTRVPRNYAIAILPPLNFNFTHAVHGALTVSRRAKMANTNQIVFDLTLTTLNGAVIVAVCHMGVDNADPAAHQSPRFNDHRGVQAGVGVSSVGYADINLGNLTGRHIIYAVHFAMAVTGIEIGVAMFVIESITNPGLDAVCQNSGMRWAFHNSARQGTCSGVKEGSLERAQHFGWQVI